MSIYYFEVQIPGRNFVVMKDDKIITNITSFNIKCDVEKTIPEIEINYGKTFDIPLKSYHELEKDIFSITFNQKNGDIKICKNGTKEEFIQSIEMIAGRDGNSVNVKQLLISENMLNNKFQ